MTRWAGPHHGLFDNPRFRAGLERFAACMRRNGVNVGEPNTSGKGPVFAAKGLNTGGAKFKAAAAELPDSLAGALTKSNRAHPGTSRRLRKPAPPCCLSPCVCVRHPAGTDKCPRRAAQPAAAWLPVPSPRLVGGACGSRIAAELGVTETVGFGSEAMRPISWLH